MSNLWTETAASCYIISFKFHSCNITETRSERRFPGRQGLWYLVCLSQQELIIRNTLGLRWYQLYWNYCQYLDCKVSINTHWIVKVVLFLRLIYNKMYVLRSQCNYQHQNWLKLSTLVTEPQPVAGKPSSKNSGVTQLAEKKRVLRMGSKKWSDSRTLQTQYSRA